MWSFLVRSCIFNSFTLNKNGLGNKEEFLPTCFQVQINPQTLETNPRVFLWAIWLPICLFETWQSRSSLRMIFCPNFQHREAIDISTLDSDGIYQRYGHVLRILLPGLREVLCGSEIHGSYKATYRSAPQITLPSNKLDIIHMKVGGYLYIDSDAWKANALWRYDD